MRPGVSLGVLGCPGVSWGNQTDPNIDNKSQGFLLLLLFFFPFSFFLILY